MGNKRISARSVLLLAGAGIVLFFVVLSAAFSIWSSKPTPYQIKVGLPTQPTAALIAIASSKGFFAQNGISATIVKYSSGKLAIEALNRGEVDIASANQTPIVFDYFGSPDYKIVASISSGDDILKVLARSDRGISSAKDLAGKKIAIQEHSASEFFLNLFLSRYHLSKTKITSVYLSPEKMPEALSTGEVDAIVIREPFIGQAEKLLREKFTLFSEPSLYTVNEVVAIKSSVLGEHPDLVRRVLTALISAEAFTLAYPDRAIRASSGLLDIPEKDLKTLWPNLHWRVVVNQELFYALKEESIWAAKIIGKEPPSQETIFASISGQDLQGLDPDRFALIR